MHFFVALLYFYLTIPISLALRFSSDFLPDLEFFQHLDLIPRWLSFTSVPESAPESFDDWLSAQFAHSSQAILDNIGAEGIRVPGAREGVVVASPSTSDPDYFYTWTRDSALVFKYLLEEFTRDPTSYKSRTLQGKIHAYITSQARLQTLPNRSGDFASGKGLGEPKFQVDEGRFDEDWGRPQNDGPALRALVGVEYGVWLVDNGYVDAAREIVWPVVRNDLAFVAEFWNTTSFDLWEEFNGASFFTTAVQHRALVQGSNFARKLGLECEACVSQAPQILCLLQFYWTDTNSGSYILANHGSNYDRSGKDTNSLLGIIHTFDPSALCDDTTFQPCSQRALANHKAVTDSFRDIYNINQGIPFGQAVAVGRYPEDVYYGGNPWYLTTFAAAEQLYDALYTWNRTGELEVTEVSLPFFKDVYDSAEIGTYPASSPQFTEIMSAVRKYADGFMKVAQKYTPCLYLLAEQFTRDSGIPTSAIDLTWSYTSFLTALARRNGIMPRPWGLSSTEVPSPCTPSSVQGTYVPASSVSWPGTLTPTSATTTSTPCPTSPAQEVRATFRVLASTSWCETVYISGSSAALGEWDVDRAVPLSAGGYKDGCPAWEGEVGVRVGERVEYKYLRKVGREVVWEQGGNRMFVVRENARCEEEDRVGRTDFWR